MIKLFNMDTSYFTVNFTNTNLATATASSAPAVYQDISEKVMRLEITEEIGKAISGTLQIQDNDIHEASTILRPGRYLQIQWGYTTRNYTGMETYIRSQNPDELTSATSPRRTLVARIREVSGNAGTDGKITYNCNFFGYEGIGQGQTQTVIYTRRAASGRGTTASYVTKKEDVVRDTFTRMGVNTMFINFRRMNEQITASAPIRRNRMTAWRFLTYLAREWRCIVRIAHDQNRQPIGLFCNYDSDNQINGFIQTAMGVLGSSLLYEYKKGRANVKSYTWQYQLSGGDSASLTIVNGLPQITSTHAETQSIITYRFVPAALQRDLGGVVSATERIRILQSMLEINTMDQLIDAGYFVPIVSTTAPQGSGMTISMDTIGNPFCTCPTRIMFGEGFPNMVRTQSRNGQLKYIVSKVSHVIDRSGYVNKMEIKDTFTLYGGSLVG